MALLPGMPTCHSWERLCPASRPNPKGPSTQLSCTLKNSNLHNYYPKPEYLIIVSFGPLGKYRGQIMTNTLWGSFFIDSSMIYPPSYSNHYKVPILNPKLSPRRAAPCSGPVTAVLSLQQQVHFQHEGSSPVHPGLPVAVFKFGSLLALFVPELLGTAQEGSGQTLEYRI